MNTLIFGLVAGWCLLSASLPVRAGWEEPPRPINPEAYTKPVDPHANSGGRRIVRIDNTIIVLCPHGRGEETYRSTDNGNTWQPISRVDAYSGSLVTGPDKMVYHFFRSGSRLLMEKYRYDHSPDRPIAIYENPGLGFPVTGPYHAVNATVDSEGTLYVATHWGSPEQIYVLRSDDYGKTWTEPIGLSDGNRAFYYPHFETTPSNDVVGAYVEWKSKSKKIWFARSENQGHTWETSLISQGDKAYNIAILPIDDKNLVVFAQSSNPRHRGLVFKGSSDGGRAWSEWQLIDATCGYADPSPALDQDGQTIYVAYRSSNGTGVAKGSCGNRSRARLAMSPDLGKTWEFVDDHYDAERTGTRSQIRYQTWWNYGGPLEWVWMQYEQGGFAKPIYYDVNHEVEIYSRPAATP